MSTVVQPFALTAVLLLLSSCVQEGYTPECGNGGAGAEDSEGCYTPVGGSCLTEEEFKADRPSSREVGNKTVTVDEDWAAYQQERPHCDFD